MPALPTPPHIVAIDHAAAIRALLQDILESDGYRVTTRGVVTDELAEIVALAPDLIILDFTGATMVDDWSFLLRLALDGRTAALPVVLCSGALRELEVLAEQLTQLGVVVVPKPFEIEELLGAVGAGLASRANAPEPRLPHPPAFATQRLPMTLVGLFGAACALCLGAGCSACANTGLR